MPPGTADAYFVTSAGIPVQALVDQVNAHINDEGHRGVGDDLRVKVRPALAVAIDVTVTAEADATQEQKNQIASGVEYLLRAAFRESVGYAQVPRVAPLERVSRSGLAGHIHENFAQVEAVDWTAPATDPQPGLELPAIDSLSVTVV